MISLVYLTRENLKVYLDNILEIERVSFPSPWGRQAFENEIMNPLSHLCALEVDGSVGGYACFWTHNDLMQVLNIAIRPDKRNQGLGYRLLTEVIEQGKNRGIKNIWLEVRVTNRAARRLYRKLGFEKVGIRRHYYPDTREDAISMSLPLRPRPNER